MRRNLETFAAYCWLITKALIADLWLPVFGLLLAIIMTAARLTSAIVQFTLAIIYNIIIAVVAPLTWLIYLVIVLPMRGSYAVAEKYELESWVKVLGIVPLIAGFVITLIWS